MADLLFFKKIHGDAWLGLRLPSDLALTVQETGTFSASKSWRYTSVAECPKNVQKVAFVALEQTVDGFAPAIKVIDVATPEVNPFTYAPFSASLSAIGELPPDLPVVDKRRTMANAIEEMLRQPALPLFLYDAYRKAVRGTVVKNPLDYLLGLVGGSQEKLRLEALSQMLFLATCADGASPRPIPEMNVFVDPAELGANGREQVSPVTVVANQGAQGVVLEFHSGKRVLTNEGILEAIFSAASGAAPPESGFGSYYEWSRTLGLSARDANSSGSVIIPKLPAEHPRAKSAFRIIDRLAADDLIGELLNYDVSMFNAHGSRMLRGRVMLKRVRMDRPAPPSEMKISLLGATADGEQCECEISFRLTDEHVKQSEAGSNVELVIYRHNFPIVPTGFYGDEDDQSLLVARQMADLDTTFASQAEYGTSQTNGQLSDNPDCNLSNHNLVLVETQAININRAQTKYSTRAKFSFAVGSATRFFFALRRVVEIAGAAPGAPESSVIAAEHELVMPTKPRADGPIEEGRRFVPHFEPYWVGADKPRTFVGSGGARVIEIRSDPAVVDTPPTPSSVCVVIQHVQRATTETRSAIGGYRLWVRDIVACHDAPLFRPVALVQALPPLVKAYAPIEWGRPWRAFDLPQLPDDDRPRLLKVPLAKPDFILLTVTTGDHLSRAKSSLKAAKEEAEKVLSRTSRDSTWFAEDAAEAESSFDEAPVDFSKVIQSLSNADVLPAVLALRDAGLAQEVALSVRKRQQLQQGYRNDFPGHWLFFQDQNGAYLGRAIHFWVRDDAAEAIPHATDVKWHYAVRESPVAYDAVGLDDFGRVAWRWNGITDLWRHELDWLIEAIPRYDPVTGRRASLDPSEGPPKWDENQVHRLTVQRRAPLRLQFSLSQRFDGASNEDELEDAFRIRVSTPPEVRQTLHNDLSRTRAGIMRMIPEMTKRSLLHHEAYVINRDDGEHQAEGRRRLLAACLAGASQEPASPKLTIRALQRPGERGEFGEILVYEPPCAEISLAVHARADGVRGPVSHIGPLRQTATQVKMLDGHRPAAEPEGDGYRITFPLARLSWSYTGNRTPVLEEYWNDAATPTPDFIEAFPGRQVLQLPDATAELHVFRLGDGVATPVLRFHADAARANDPPQFPQSTEFDLPWGSAVGDGEQVQHVEYQNDALSLTTVIQPAEIRYQWRVQGKSIHGEIV